MGSKNQGTQIFSLLFPFRNNNVGRGGVVRKKRYIKQKRENLRFARQSVPLEQHGAEESANEDADDDVA